MAEQGWHKDVKAPNDERNYYPPISDNRYKGLIYWWIFAELRADPDQVERCADHW